MPDVKFSRDPTRFDCLGIDVNRPVDSVKDQKFVYLQNMRSYQYGRIEPRLGLTDIGIPASGQSPVHSCRRLNDPSTGNFIRVIGSGVNLAYESHGLFTNVNSGFSSLPLAMVPWRPDQSTTAYMYIADLVQMRKLARSGVFDTIGYPAPTSEPGVALNFPSYQAVDQFDDIAWTPDGTHMTVSSNVARIGTTIAQIVYDKPSLNEWATIQLDVMIGVGVGSVITLGTGVGAEGVVVQSVSAGSVSTHIAGIVYDSGSNGLGSLVMTAPVDQAVVDAMIYNITLSQAARIVGVGKNPDGNSSIRLETTSTWAAGNQIQILPSFRVYTIATRAVGNAAVANALRVAVTPGTGYITKTVALDLSVIQATVPAHSEDYMHISFRVDRPDFITELRCMLDVDAATNDFTRNYYFRAFRASDITAAVRAQQAFVDARATVIQREIIDTDIPQEGSQTSTRGFTEEELKQLDQVTTLASSDAAVSQQMATGDTQWFELIFRLSDLVRVGTDDTRSLQNVAAIRIMAIVTGSVVLDIDSWWIGGGYGPDALPATAIPYQYRYRVRNPATGARSNWGPATRTEVSPRRQQVGLTPPLYTLPGGTSGFTAADLVLDIQRFGGEIPVWHYVGTCANTAAPYPFFFDKFPDDIVAGNDAEGQINWQPWPIISTPVFGTTGTVAGTTVQDSGANFDLNWAPGTLIRVNGIAYTIYRVISITKLELVESAGSQTGVSWRIDEPILLGQPLSCLWGDEQIGAMFACGDILNPGRLYFSNGNNPDSTTETNYIDITSPSEPLMNGVVFNQRSYVFSSERMFQILRTDTAWTAQEIPNGQGLFARWAITRNPSPAIFFLGKDGIYGTTGGEPVSLTDNDLFPIFPTEGSVGTTTNNVGAPNIDAAAQRNLRLEYYDGFLYFDYPDTAGNRVTLVNLLEFGGTNGGWYFDTYTPGVVFHYGEEGPNVHSLLVGGADATSGRLYQYAGYSDNGALIVCGVRTPARDQGDPRSNKLYGDVMLDADTQGVPVTCTPWVNNYQTALPATIVTTASRLQTAIPTGATSWTTARNLGLEMVFAVSTAARPMFYIWEVRYTFEAAPISASSWQISPTSYGMENWKHYGLFRIAHVSTISFTVTVYLDGIAQPPITIPASGGIYTQTVFRVPVWKFKLSAIRLAGTGGTEFRLDGRDSFFQVKEWGSEGPYQPLHVFGDYAMVEG